MTDDVERPVVLENQKLIPHIKVRSTMPNTENLAKRPELSFGLF
jgi:hypothetical protein